MAPDYQSKYFVQEQTLATALSHPGVPRCLSGVGGGAFRGDGPGAKESAPLRFGRSPAGVALTEQKGEPGKRANALLATRRTIDLSIAEKFMAALKSERDPAAGEAAFQQHCATCHQGVADDPWERRRGNGPPAAVVAQSECLRTAFCAIDQGGVSGADDADRRAIPEVGGLSVLRALPPGEEPSGTGKQGHRGGLQVRWARAGEMSPTWIIPRCSNKTVRDPQM
jgi:mono/diheme cytochrome c family protein